MPVFTSDKVYPLSAARALALHAQGLTASSGSNPEPTPGVIYQTIERLGCLQIDTLQMVARSHYLVLWSRLGVYRTEYLEQMIYNPLQRKLFEGWQHAASIIPLEEYRYQLPNMRRNREAPWIRTEGWLADPQNRVLLPAVLERIRREGALRGMDFEYNGPKRSGWWDWKPSKRALEILVDRGDLMITNRLNFQRVYDLTERVLPDWVDTTEPTPEERDRHWVEQGARALGVCAPLQVAEYAWMRRGQARPHVESLIKEGILAPFKAHLVDGKVHDMVIHREYLLALEAAADGALCAQRTTFLSPFDSLFWAGGRDEQVWGFRQTLEAYLPAHRRVWGYFCLPILHKDGLVGRVDVKLERGAHRMRIKTLYLEPDIEPEESMIVDVAAAMRNFLDFHGARDLIIEHSQPTIFGDKLLSAI
jgi:uncharacterized protein YcaQ